MSNHCITKTCSKCGTEKELSEFYNSRTTKGGVLGRCKSCIKEYVKANRAENMKCPEFRARRREINAKSTARKGRTIYSPVKHAAYNVNTAARYPERALARRITKYAIKTGKLLRLPCEKCGDVISHAHHEDYSNPLEVVFLCRRHHVERHNEINAGKVASAKGGWSDCTACAAKP